MRRSSVANNTLDVRVTARPSRADRLKASGAGNHHGETGASEDEVSYALKLDEVKLSDHERRPCCLVEAEVNKGKEG